MKILQVISSFPPAYSYGGALKVAFELSRELVRNGHEVTVCTTDVYDSKSRLKHFKNPETIEGIEVYRFKNLSNWLSRKNITCAPGMFFFLRDNMKKFDIIHLHEYRSFQAIFTIYFARKYRIPYIVQAHGSVLPFFEKQNLKKMFDFVWGNKILKDARKCIALTKTESDQYRKMGVPNEKIAIIPNGLDLLQFSNLPKRGMFRSKYEISDNEQIILFLARIHKIKGIDLLIDAYSQLLEDLPHTRLVIAGPDDGYLSTIQNQIRRMNLDREILITGPLHGPDKLAAYVDADVYVLPSRYEAFPNTILESWACGTPVIITDACAISSMVHDAVLVVKWHPTELANAIKKILIDKPLWEKYSKKGQALVNREYNLETIVTNMEACYRQVINNVKKD